MCVSDRPTDLKILPPTLTFFMPKKKNRLAKSRNLSPFPCLFPTSIIEIKNGEYTQVITKTLYCMSNN